MLSEPAQLRAAMAYTSYIAHAASTLTVQGRLETRGLPPTLRGGLLAVEDAGGAGADAEETARTIAQLCVQRSFRGTVLTAAAPRERLCLPLAGALERALETAGRRLLVSEVYASDVERAAVVVGTALSGGDLRGRLEACTGRWGAERLAVRVERTRMDFPIPCPTGEGRPLTQEQLHALARGHSIFFSEPLCARYFTCSAGGAPHFVLFDDADTIRRKLAVAAELGIGTALLDYGQTAGAYFWRCAGVGGMPAGYFSRVGKVPRRRQDTPISPPIRRQKNPPPDTKKYLRKSSSGTFEINSISCFCSCGQPRTSCGA